MTDQPTFEERQAQRRQAEDDLRDRLAALQLDGPHEFPTGGGFDPVSSMFASEVRNQYAICLTCGAVVMLNDPEDRDGSQIERSVRIHATWHEENR